MCLWKFLFPLHFWKLFLLGLNFGLIISSFSILKILLHYLLACIVSEEKSIVFIFFPSHVMYLYSLVAFKVLFLCFAFSDLNIICLYVSLLAYLSRVCGLVSIINPEKFLVIVFQIFPLSYSLSLLLLGFQLHVYYTVWFWYSSWMFYPVFLFFSLCISVWIIYFDLFCHSLILYSPVLTLLVSPLKAFFFSVTMLLISSISSWFFLIVSIYVLKFPIFS